MALSVVISGVTYVGLDTYQIKQQAGAVSSTSVEVRVDAQAIPTPLQSCSLVVDGTTVFAGLIKSVGYPEHQTGYEAKVYSLEVVSIETVLTFRLANKNWYNKTYSQIVTDIFTTYLLEEGLILGAVSATTPVIKRYQAQNTKVYDVLSDIAAKVGGCSFWITPDKVFNFQVSTDSPAATVPAHISGLKLSVEFTDLRTVQVVKGASSGATGTATNAALKASIAAASGFSGKIETVTQDGDIRNPTSAAAEAVTLLDSYGEREQTLSLYCHDLTASQLYRMWAVNRPELGIVGNYVVTERTISHHDGVSYKVSVKLKNHNFFSRSGYALKAALTAAQAANNTLADIASDGVFSAVEKLGARTEWVTIASEKDGFVLTADKYGLVAEKAAYLAAFQALADYLNGGTTWTIGDPLWLSADRLSIPEDIDPAAFTAAWTNYATAKNDFIRSGNLVPKYLGPVTAAPSTANIGDWCYNSTANVMQKYTAAGWVTDTASDHIAGAMGDILAVEDASLGGNTAAINYIQNLVAKTAFFDAIKGRSLDFELGHIGGVEIGTDFLRSTNYAFGTTGFILRSDGTAELNSLSINVDLTSSNYVAGTSGFKLDKATGSIDAMQGTIGGFILGSSTLDSSAAGSPMITLNASSNRVEVKDSLGTVNTAMGYLGGLLKNGSPYSTVKNYAVGDLVSLAGITYKCLTINGPSSSIHSPSGIDDTWWDMDPSDVWSTSDYGFWAKQSTYMRIEGDVQYANGDWTIGKDSSYIIKQGATVISRLGSLSGQNGLWINEANIGSDYRARLTSSSFYVGNDSSAISYENNFLTVTSGGRLGGIESSNIWSGSQVFPSGTNASTIGLWFRSVLPNTPTSATVSVYATYDSQKISTARYDLTLSNLVINGPGGECYILGLTTHILTVIAIFNPVNIYASLVPVSSAQAGMTPDIGSSTRPFGFTYTEILSAHSVQANYLYGNGLNLTHIVAETNANLTGPITSAGNATTLNPLAQTVPATWTGGGGLKPTSILGGILGSIPYQSAVDTTTLLSPNSTPTKKYLRQTNGTAPAWDIIDTATTAWNIPITQLGNIWLGT